MVTGMSVKEPYIALGACAVWGVYGAVYFLRNSKAKARAVMVDKPVVGAGRVPA
jgi:Ni,Fe-hydrogenase I small subunit